MGGQMKPRNRAINFFLLIATFYLSLHVAYPDLQGDHLCDSELVYGQKTFALLPICPENRETGFEKAPLSQENLTPDVFLKPRYYYQRLLNLLPEIFRTRLTFPESTELLNLFCVLRI